MKIVKNLKIALSLITLAVLSACSGITNLSPERVTQNPSNVYTLSMSVFINDSGIVKNSVKGFLVIDQQYMPMTEIGSHNGDRTFEVEYAMPKHRIDAKYYYVVKYKVHTGAGGIVDKEITSPMAYTLKPETSYIMSMQFDRGPIGAVVPVMGRGFHSQDKIKFGNVYADIESVNRSSLNFIVPPLTAGRHYDVEIESGGKTSFIGRFKIDSSEITCSYDKIEIMSGDTLQLIFDIGFVAPEGGYAIEVQTNIPSSVIMHEVVVAPGKTSVVVPFKAGAAGNGKLFVSAVGFREKVIPVTVLPAEIKERSSADKLHDKINQLSKE